MPSFSAFSADIFEKTITAFRCELTILDAKYYNPPFPQTDQRSMLDTLVYVRYFPSPALLFFFVLSLKSWTKNVDHPNSK